MPTSLRKFCALVRKIFFPGAGVIFPSLTACRGVESIYDKNFTFCVFTLLHSPHVEVLEKKMTNTPEGASYVPFHALNATISDSISKLLIYVVMNESIRLYGINLKNAVTK